MNPLADASKFLIGVLLSLVGGVLFFLALVAFISWKADRPVVAYDAYGHPHKEAHGWANP